MIFLYLGHPDKECAAADSTATARRKLRTNFPKEGTSRADKPLLYPSQRLFFFRSILLLRKQPFRVWLYDCASARSCEDNAISFSSAVSAQQHSVRLLSLRSLSLAFIRTLVVSAALPPSGASKGKRKREGEWNTEQESVGTQLLDGSVSELPGMIVVQVDAQHISLSLPTINCLPTAIGLSPHDTSILKQLFLLSLLSRYLALSSSSLCPTPIAGAEQPTRHCAFALSG